MQTGALRAKAPSSLRVCTGWSKPSLIKYDQIKKRTFTDEVKARHRLIRAFSDVYVAFPYFMLY